MTLKVTKKEYQPAQTTSFNSQPLYKIATLPWHWFTPNGSTYYQVPEMTYMQLLAGTSSRGYLVPGGNGFTVDPLWPGGGYYLFPPPVLANFRISKQPSASYLKSVTSRYLKYLEVKNSSNTPGWFSSQGTKDDVLALTKSKPPSRRPKKPVLYASRVKLGPRPEQKSRVVLLMIPPSPRGGEGSTAYRARLALWSSRKLKREDRLTELADRQFRRRLSLYVAKEQRIKLSETRRQEAYKKALKNYEAKEARYQLLLARSKEHRYHRAPKSSIVHQDNPFWRAKMHFIGPPLRFDLSLRYPWKGYSYMPEDYGRLPGLPFGHETETYPPATKKWWGVEAVCVPFVMDDSLTDKELCDYAEGVRKHIFDLVNVAITEYDDKLKRKIHQKLKNQTVHIGNIIAERKQTLDLVQSTVKRILSLIKLKKNIFKAAASYVKSPKAMANDILAFKFGVEPLMNDIMSFAKYIDESSDSPIVTVRTNTGPKGIPFQLDVPGLKFVGHLKLSYVVKCRVDNPTSRTLSEFGLINPLEILWEVTPWSFVVDWFLPVGDWISNKTADCGLSFLTGTRSITLEGSFTANGLQTEIGASSGNQSGLTDLFREFYGEMMERTVFTDLPNLPPIKLKNPWSWSHGVESVALLVQKLKIR